MNLNRVAVRLAAVAMAFAAAACAPLLPRQPLSEFHASRVERAHCAAFFRQADDVVVAAGVGDAMAARVPGFPQLRASRFLASFADEPLDQRARDEWIDRLAQLGEEGRAVEIANLPAADRARLDRNARTLTGLPSARAALAGCTDRLTRADRAAPQRIAALRDAVRVPDDYLTWQRVAGLYWLTRVPFAHGVRQWQARTQAVFARPLAELPLAGQRVRYQAPPVAAGGDVAALLERARADSVLGIADPQGADRELLFRLFAPDFVVDVASASDQPGPLGWHRGAMPAVDSTAPVVVYRRLSHTRHQGRVLLQLNYAIWFPERPLDSAWDLLGGHLDAVVWRVTLTPRGEPWVYDSMHHCGCYHLFFPTARAELKPQPATLDETVFAPQWLPAIEPATRLTLLLAARTHYLQRVLTDGAAVGTVREVAYRFADDDELRSLVATADRRRSAFRPDGIVPGTERGERYLFWPMGVPEPGAMRQWGRHATAFVGRRHFDDADLFERYFEMLER